MKRTLSLEGVLWLRAELKRIIGVEYSLPLLDTWKKESENVGYCTVPEEITLSKKRELIHFKPQHFDSIL